MSERTAGGYRARRIVMARRQPGIVPAGEGFSPQPDEDSGVPRRPNLAADELRDILTTVRWLPRSATGLGYPFRTEPHKKGDARKAPPKVSADQWLPGGLAPPTHERSKSYRVTL